MIRLFSLISFILLVTSCSLLSKPARPELTITVQKPNEIRFQGKGAFIGARLSQDMGAMGMAIGITVDNNIQTEINTAANTVNFDIERLIEEALKNRWKKQSSKWKTIDIKVVRYSLAYTPGEPELTYPEMHLIVNIDNRYDRTLRYPDNFPTLKKPEAPLKEVQNDGKVTLKLFRNALTSVAKLL